MIHRYEINAEQAGKTLAAIVRNQFSELSWSKVRRMIESRRVRVGEYLCMDAARRLKEGDRVEILDHPLPPPPKVESTVLRHVDEHIVVVEKPANIATVRHPAERAWPERRKVLNPTLDDLVLRQLAAREHVPLTKLPRLRIVHRLDKQTSGLLVFARTVAAEIALGKQFKKHTVHRRYLAIIPGYLPPQTITSYLVRDRGDGYRGSSSIPGQGKRAVTHVDVEERLDGYTLLSCRLETGRTHQIRIHLAEKERPICGDPVYHHLPGGKLMPDESGAPHLALHAVELGFEHPITKEEMFWSMPMPKQLQAFLDSLRGEC